MMLTLWEGGSKIRKCQIKSNFQNYGTMVVDSLKRPSWRVEKENITLDRYCVSKAFKFDFFCQKWPFLSKTTKNSHFWQRTSNLNAFETQYLSDVIYFIFLLLETDVLSYLPPFYHNFENLTLYGIYEYKYWVNRP